MTKPFKTYIGGKNGSGVYQAIINEIPPHEIYISGFAGNCGVMANKLPATMANIAIDIDAAVIDGWSKIQGVKKLQGDAQTEIPRLLNLYAAKQVFIFLDPPYLNDTRATQKNLYKFEMSDQPSHEKLLLEIKKWQVPVMIIHYPCALYDNVLTNWRQKDIQGCTRTGRRTERLYMNYPAPTALHDYRYLGGGF